MTKIYVGNLPFSADEASVRVLFEAHGKVDSVALINDRETGRPRGFGFVEMPSADAQRAIATLNGQNMGGRPLRVNEMSFEVFSLRAMLPPISRHPVLKLAKGLDLAVVPTRAASTCLPSVVARCTLVKDSASAEAPKGAKSVSNAEPLKNAEENSVRVGLTCLPSL